MLLSHTHDIPLQSFNELMLVLHYAGCLKITLQSQLQLHLTQYIENRNNHM